MNKLLFDLIATQPSPEARFHGGAEYAKIIFLKAVEKEFFNFECIYNPNLELDEDILKLCKEKKIKLIPKFKNKDIEEYININNFEKFYSSLPYEYVNFNLKNTLFIMDVLGVRELEMPKDVYEIVYRKTNFLKIKLLARKHLFSKRNNIKFVNKYSKLLKQKNKHILTISNHSKYSLLNFFPELKSSEITVNYAPLDFSDTDVNTIQKGNYFLLISANRWIKNNYRAIKALDSLFSEGKLQNKRVIVLGLDDENQFKIKNKDFFLFKDYVEEQELVKYYKNAYCFIYPTLNEGFGYPPLHAMKYKTPVLASAISAVPEICQNAVLYFNPFSISEIKNRILRINDDKNLYKNLQNKGIERLGQLELMQKEMLENLLKRIFE